jgi:hypothetical protein
MRDENDGAPLPHRYNPWFFWIGVLVAVALPGPHKSTAHGETVRLN